MTTQPLAPIRWVYSLRDYRALFNLTRNTLKKRILEFPATVSSFNFQMTALGHHVVSASPLYTLEQGAMDALVQERMQALTALQVACIGEGGTLPGDTSQCVRRWRRMSDIFLTDYPAGTRAGRYAFSGNTHVAFADNSFDLALCVAVETPAADLPELIVELARVSQEFRLVLSIDEGAPPAWLPAAMEDLQERHCQVSFQPTETLYGDGQWVLLKATQMACVVVA